MLFSDIFVTQKTTQKKGSFKEPFTNHAPFVYCVVKVKFDTMSEMVIFTSTDSVLKPGAEASTVYLPAITGCGVNAIGSVPGPYWPSSGAPMGNASVYSPVSISVDVDFTVTVGPPGVKVCFVATEASGVVLGRLDNTVPLMLCDVEVGIVIGPALVLTIVTTAVLVAIETGTPAMTTVAWSSAVITRS